MGRDQCQYIDVERAASTPERFHQAVAAASPFTMNGQSPAAQDAAASARGAFDRTLALIGRARAASDAPATFLLDEVLELRTFESFPGPAPRAARDAARDGGERQPLRADQPLRRARACACCATATRASK